MYAQKFERNRSYKYRDDSESQQKFPQSTIPIQQKPQPLTSNPYMRIITNINDPQILKLKRGKNTPAIHIFTLRKYMHQFKQQYQRKDKDGKLIANYYDDAWRHLLKITDVEEDQSMEENILRCSVKKEPKKKNVNTKDLVELFGGDVPDKNDQQAVKWFLIRRMNARTLQLIYQKHQVEIMFGSSKMEDKLTNSLFIYEYRTRLPNPLLCGGLECIRPMEKQKKYPKKQKAQGSQEKKEKTSTKKTKKIEKKY